MSPSEPPSASFRQVRAGADPFIACLQSVLRRWDRSIAYECLAGLSGTAFSPPLCRDPDCVGLWVEEGSDQQMDFLGHCLGFVARPTTAADSCEDIGKSAGEGPVVLWRLSGTWGIAEGPVSGSGKALVRRPGRPPRRHAVDEAQGAYVLRRADPCLTRCESIREAIRHGSALADGTQVPCSAAFGGQIYDAWLERLAEPEFCPRCGPDGWRCAAHLGRRTRGCQQAAHTFLSRAQQFLPQLGSDRHAGAAADAYRAMAARLRPYCDGEEARQLLQKRKGRARYALAVEEVRRLHQKAARQLSLLACVL